MKVTEMKSLARTLFNEGVLAANPARAVESALEANPISPVPNGRLLVIAFGKAACAMTEQALQHVPQGQAFEAIVVTNYENARDMPECSVFAAGHPLPDANGLKAGREVMAILAGATHNDAVLCLISGGGSALMPTPRKGLSLEDKTLVSEILLSEGLDITQMNTIRQQLSVLKGGGLTDLAYPAKVRSLIISDVVGDDISAIASGPTAHELKGFEDTLALLKARGIWTKLPASARTLLATPRSIQAHEADNTIICSNPQSLHAIAQAAPAWSPQIIADPLVGDVAQAAQQIVAFAAAQPILPRQLFIWGGETTVQLRGDGKGGRNQEMAVRVATQTADLAGNWVFLSGGTDGRDGPTDAAGGMVTAQTLQNAKAQGIDVTAALHNNDSYAILSAADDLLMTGATGTNVADIQLLLRTD